MPFLWLLFDFLNYISNFDIKVYFGSFFDAKSAKN